jgi:hypothetical protein
VWFHRISAIIWILLLIPAYIWFRQSVAFVIAASVYANVKSDWAASEAADDGKVLDAIDAVRSRIDALTDVVLSFDDDTTAGLSRIEALARASHHIDVRPTGVAE